MVAFLKTRTPFLLAELFTLTLANGAQFFWTSAGYSITNGGTTWVALGPLISRSRISVKGTAEIPEMDVKIAAADTTTINGTSIKLAVHDGIFDGAHLECDRVFMRSPGDTSLGLLVMFKGRASQSQITASGVALTCKGDTVLMNQQVPRHLYQTTCLHTFCDTGCTLLAANYTTTNTVGSSPSPSTSFIPWGSSPANPALYTLGSITFTSGVCNGQTRDIANPTSSGMNLVYPLYGTPSPGDTFTVLMGCTRTLNACQTRTTNIGGSVNNQQNFRGEPWVPQAEYGV